MTIFRCCKLNFYQWRLHPKYPLIAGFMILMMWNLTNGFSAYAAHLGAKIHPWLFPFLPCHGLNFMIIILPYILLICDAPFRNGQQQYVIQRTGKIPWLCGQLLFLFLTAILYATFLWVLSWIFLLPNIEWNPEWGGVLRTAAKLQDYGEYKVDMNFDYEIMKTYSAVFSNTWVYLMLICVLFLMGECMVFCNLFLYRGVGVALTIGMLLFNLMICFETYGRRFLLWISPISWLNLSMIGRTSQGLPSLLFSAVSILGLCLLVGGMTVGMIHKCNLIIETE